MYMMHTTILDIIMITTTIITTVLVGILVNAPLRKKQNNKNFKEN
jgi:hypothetical protein